MSAVLVPNEISMIVNSNPSDGAQNVSADGSTFQVNLEDGGLQIPLDAMNVNVSVESASIWYTTPNILNENNEDFTKLKNNLLYIKTIVGGSLETFNIVIPEGLYDVALLNDAVEKALKDVSAPQVGGPLFSFSADQATGKIIITFNPNATGTEIDFTPPFTLRELLGFGIANIKQVDNAQPTAPNVARFNSLNNYIIHSDIVSNGIRFNNSYIQAISEVLIDAAPYDQINFLPFNPAKSDASDLKGSHRNNITFWLTDQDNLKVDTNGEYWSMRMVIRYDTVMVLT